MYVACTVLLCLNRFSFQSSLLQCLSACSALCLLSVMLVELRQASSEGACLRGTQGWDSSISKMYNELVLGQIFQRRAHSGAGVVVYLH